MCLLLKKTETYNKRANKSPNLFAKYAYCLRTELQNAKNDIT